MGEAERGRGAAHVLFHVEHAGVVLDVEAAGVEADALADKSHLRIGLLAPDDVDQAGAARRTLAYGVNQRKFLGQPVAGDNLDPGAVLLGERPRRGFQLIRPHVVRRRIDQVARQGDAFGNAAEVVAIDSVRHGQPHIARLALAIAGELIGAGREGQRREPRVVRRIGEAVDAGRQGVDQLAGPERVEHVAGAFDAEQNAGELAVELRQQQQFAGLGFKADGSGESALALAERFQDRLAIVGVDEPDRNAARFGCAGELWMHDYSAASLKEGLGA